MNMPLTYLPAYVGLYVSLVLAVTASAFLDIQYGSFGVEVLIWAIVFLVTLGVGWRQRGQVTGQGRRWQRWMFALGALASVLVFLPGWGLPRGGIYMLAALQASYNCVTTGRRQLHFGLLVATVIVMFAASHYRADWTMLFYLVPFVVAVVFTLVAEQVSRRVEDLRAQSLGDAGRGGQGLAIAAASTVILLLAGLLYAVTPHLSWTELSWRMGVPAGTESGHGSRPPGGSPGTDGSGSGSGEAGAAGSGGLTPQQMRLAAQRSGMPRWQAAVITTLADVAEGAGQMLAPVRDAFRELGAALKEWARKHRQQLIGTLIALLVAALLLAFWYLLKEARIALWLVTRVDYLRYVLLGRHVTGRAGAVQLYRATERLFALQELPRPRKANAREYLAQLGRVHYDLRPTLIEMTILFENARYGASAPGDRELRRMRRLYRELFERAF
jgi:hypothetical protein